MKQILITTIEELEKYDLSNFEVTEDISIEIRLKLVDQKIEYPIKVFHKKENLSSDIKVKAALYGNSELKMPVEIIVEKGAKNTATNFKALVYILSPNSKAHVTPGLFIHEKDIQKAGHGVVIKNIKDKDTVYLETRGINKETAKELIVNLL